jgi:YD repeat-containing protein
MSTFFRSPSAKSRAVPLVVAACLPVLLLLAVLAGCRQDRETEPTGPTFCVLSAVRGFQGDVLERFAFNPAGQLTEYTLDGLRYRLRYDGAGQLVGVLESGVDAEGVAFEREITLHYAGDGKTVVVRKQVELAPAPHEYTAELGEKGQLLRYIGNENGRKVSRRYEYDEAGNVVRSFSAQDASEHLDFEQTQFDGKPSPYYAPGSLRTFMQLVFGKAISAHNPLVTRHYNGAGALDWTRTDRNTYGDRGFLVRQQGNFAGFDYALEYVYTCR